MKPVFGKLPIGHPYDPTLPRFDFVEGQWVKVDPSVKQEPNPEYVDAPVLEAWFGFPKKEDS